VSEIRELFAAFEMKTVGLQYTVSGGRGVEAKELIITGGGE